MQPWAELGPHVQWAPELKILLAEPSFCSGCCWISWYHRPRVNIRGVEVNPMHLPRFIHFYSAQYFSAQVILCCYSLLSHHAATHKTSLPATALTLVPTELWFQQGEANGPAGFCFCIVMVYFKWNKLKNTLCFAVEEVSHTLLK